VANKPKKQTASQATKTDPAEYVAVVGINTSDETRYEAGAVIAGADLLPDDKEAFLEMGAIAVHEPKKEDKDNVEDPDAE